MGNTGNRRPRRSVDSASLFGTATPFRTSPTAVTTIVSPGTARTGFPIGTDPPGHDPPRGTYPRAIASCAISIRRQASTIEPRTGGSLEILYSPTGMLPLKFNRTPPSAQTPSKKKSPQAHRVRCDTGLASTSPSSAVLSELCLARNRLIQRIRIKPPRKLLIAKIVEPVDQQRRAPLRKEQLHVPRQPTYLVS